ncbi:helix-turn-helix domain-containing protein [Roseovarius sp.]|uniref:helix-turn-helix domain-containing protein n=1 Tax=Roseovarius sp. TaxID=1486281 RepID=UPI00261B49AE|nr:helix-turn-helix domain-containing protein [Roseovarius sp.]
MYVTFSTEYHRFNSIGSAVPAVVPSKSGPVRTIRSGAYLYREGDEVMHVYEVIEGVLRLTRLLEDGRRQVIAFGYPGDIVGFPSNGRHHTDCDALTEAKVRPYCSSALEDGTNNPHLQRALLEAAFQEISAMQDHFMMLGRKSASEKLASFLLTLCERAGNGLDCDDRITLPMSRADIADFLGLTTETISRTFGQLRKAGILRVEHIYTVVILRPDALRTTARGDDA